MKKIYCLAFIGILIFSSIQVNALTNKENNQNIVEINKNFIFSKPIIEDIEEYATIKMDETSKTLGVPGKPEIPLVPFTIELPFKANNIVITYTPSDEYEMDISKKIKPTPPTVSPNNNRYTSFELDEDTEAYSSTNRYPDTWFEYRVTCGLNMDGELKTHVTLNQFPVQYSPKNNKIYYINEATIKISYNPPDKPLSFKDEYDLVIIAPPRFSSGLGKLVNHKNDNNVRTMLKTTKDIYKEFQGFDKPEQIKKFIQYAKENYNVSYVLLVGGLKRYVYAKDRDDPNQGTKAWHLPVRYTNIIKGGGLHDEGCLSDLYYADLYKENGEFENWDSNDDGILAQWGSDTLDLRPDVILCRLPCRNILELNIVVNKIIKYESSTPSPNDWYKRMIGIAGLNHGMHLGQPDAEWLADLVFGYMDSLTDEEVRVFASNNGTGGLIPETKDIIKAFTKGARFVYMPGHGSPLKWGCHPIEGTSTWMQGIYSYKMWRFFNSGKLPVVVVGGCHCAQFNITFLNTLRTNSLNNNSWYWTGGMPGASCLNWKMLITPWGGAIASVGGTGLTTSKGGQPNSLNGELATNTYYMIGQEGAETFGDAYTGSLLKFLDENTYIGLSEYHAFTIWQAFGDPSLKLA
jgi:hypothetical protein